MISFSNRMEKQRLDLLFCKRKKEFESARLYRSLINAEINSFVRREIKPLFFFKRSKIGRNGGRPTVRSRRAREKKEDFYIFSFLQS